MWNKFTDYCGRLTLAAIIFLTPLLSARAATLVQDFYLPMPEAQIYQANSALVAGAGVTNFSTFSIVVTGDGTQIYYDQWEDGYEVNLAAPTQSTTLVWGDGNNANGICPGFTNDPSGIPAGTVITLFVKVITVPAASPDGSFVKPGQMPLALLPSPQTSVVDCAGAARLTS